LTIAFDDLSLPLPPMAAPDVRQLVMEEVIDMAAEAGIDDLHIIAALGLHRRMTEDELRHIVGERIFSTFHPDRLYQHDGEDTENNVYIGKTAEGEEVTLNRRAAESDLVVYINLTLVPMDGGHKSMSTGLASFRSIRAHHNAKTLLASRRPHSSATSFTQCARLTDSPQYRPGRSTPCMTRRWTQCASN